MTIKIITIGNKTSSHHRAIVDAYMKRFPRHITIDWHYIKHGSGSVPASMAQESENILKKLSQASRVILLDEIGEQLSSPQLAEKIFADTQDTIFIIGGAYGVSAAVTSRADFVWSLSRLVFPHELVRVLLSEQLYRAYTISIDHPYHHQ